MSTNQEETPNEVTPSWVDNLKTKLGSMLSSWQFKVGLVSSMVIAVLLTVFFWPHMIAVAGMKGWSSHAGAKPIDCMIKDTNNDQYVSCSALLDEQVVPLECGASIFNIGCRINYGAASPPVTKSQPRL